MRFGLVGRDARQLAVAEALREMGHSVETVYLHSSTLPQALVFPMPLSEDGGTVFGTGELLSDWWKRLRGKTVFAGRVDAEQAAAANAAGVTLHDHFAVESETVRNILPTVEGALMLAIQHTDFTLHGAECLVVGFGRIAKLLTQYLKALGASVTVCSRRAENAAWCALYGYRHIFPAALDGFAGALIFNTVPAPLFEGKVLTVPFIELASGKGGAPAGAAPYIDGRALPARVAPRTAGEIIAQTILEILKEEHSLAI